MQHYHFDYAGGKDRGSCIEVVIVVDCDIGDDACVTGTDGVDGVDNLICVITVAVVDDAVVINIICVIISIIACVVVVCIVVGIIVVDGVGVAIVRYAVALSNLLYGWCASCYYLYQLDCCYCHYYSCYHKCVRCR